MTGYIDGYNFAELNVMKYWAPPSSWSAEKRKTETHNRIFSGEWYGARKVDGALYVFLKDEDGNITLRGRSKSVNGEYIDKWDHVPHLHEWGASIPNGTCFLGEIYWPGHEGSNNTTSIMNCLAEKAIKRQEKDENKMHYYIFDVMAYNGESWICKPAEERFSNIVNCFYIDERNSFWYHYVEGAHYESGEALWNLLQELLIEGYEGVVITRGSAQYQPGKRPSKDTMKIKQELKQTIDCFFTGNITPPTKEYNGKEPESWPYWINYLTNERLPVGEHYREAAVEGKPYQAVTKPFYNKWAGSLEIGLVEKSNGRCRLRSDDEWVEGLNIISLGFISGLTDEVKANYRDYIGKVIEVGAMMLTPDGDRLRHGKMIGWRLDKSWQECGIEQLKDI